MSITAIIPTYNRAEFITRVIESVQNQSYKVDEIIVVDDGSTDNTKEIVSKYKDVIYIYQENRGVSSARNSGIKASSSEYIAFLDSDDIWHEEKIKEQMSLHKSTPHIALSYTDEKWIRGDKEIKKKAHNLKKHHDIFLQSLNNCVIGCSTVMIKRDVLNDIGYFDESMEVCEDYDLWIRVMLKYDVALIEKELITKYAGHEQLSFKYWGMDRWRVRSLEKYTDSEYKDEIIAQIIKKSTILANGAKKRDNKELYNYYTEKIRFYEK
jgi:glycosyltransferase involved in cell wall biosynthesis